MSAVELELHQLELRYEHLRKHQPRAERALLASLVDVGQQLPVVVVSDAGRFVLIDGHKRVRALKRLARDNVLAVAWQLTEVDALLLQRSLRCGSEDALEQAWLLTELQERFGYSLDELARRFGCSKSWVSRRLALVQALPPTIHEQVRLGAISAHAAMKYLVPLARANGQLAARFAAAIEPLKLATREVGVLYDGWQKGSQRIRELILENPKVYLDAKASQNPAPPSATQNLLNDLGALGGIARRVVRTLESGIVQQLLAEERLELDGAYERARADIERLFNRMELESNRVG